MAVKTVKIPPNESKSENTTKWKWKYHQGLREDSHHIRCSSSPPSMGLCYQFYWIKLINWLNNSQWWVLPMMMIWIAVIKMINLLLLPWLMMKSAGDPGLVDWLLFEHRHCCPSGLRWCRVIGKQFNNQCFTVLQPMHCNAMARDEKDHSHGAFLHWSRWQQYWL